MSGMLEGGFLDWRCGGLPVGILWAEGARDFGMANSEVPAELVELESSDGSRLCRGFVAGGGPDEPDDDALLLLP